MKTLTAKQFKAIRIKTNLSLKEMAEWLYMEGQWASRNIRRWEDATYPIPGSVVKAFELAGFLELLENAEQ